MAGGGSRRRRVVDKLKAVLRRKKDNNRQEEQKQEGEEPETVVVDGSDIRELVGNKEVFNKYVDKKFGELDVNHDGKLSVTELQPAVADIGAAIGLPAQGVSPDSDQIYSEVLNEFTHGQQEEVSKTEFKEVLSDILLGMAAGLSRDPVVILRIDGEDLREFINSPSFEIEGIAIYSRMESKNLPLGKCITMALEQLTVGNGMPPSTDSWVMSNVVEPALGCIAPEQLEQPVPQEIFLIILKQVMKNISQRLKEHPVIVAHSENTFDGSSIKRLLSNKFELEKLLNFAWRKLPKDQSQKASKECLRAALDEIAPSAGLPPYGAVDQVDVIVNEGFRLANVDDEKGMLEDEFKAILTEMLGSIMLQLEGSPIFVSSSSVVHEHFSSPNLLTPTPEEVT